MSISSILSKHATRTALIFVLLMLCAAGDAVGCDSDLDCGPGGTCIKREKRARGVCYGGASRTAPQPAAAKQSVQSPTQQVISPPGGLSLDDSLDAPVYGEDPSVTPPPAERKLVPLEDDGGFAPAADAAGMDPGPRTKRSDGCISSNDCPAGLECIYRDPMRGVGECMVYEQ